MQNLMETKNWSLYSQCLSSERIEITNVLSYWGVITNVLHSSTSKVLVSKFFNKYSSVCHFGVKSVTLIITRDKLFHSYHLRISR